MSMIAKNSIVIRNVYYMMAYAFRALGLREYEKLKTEEFENADDLLAAILAIGISTQLKRGLERSYHEVEEDIPGVCGRLNVAATARHAMSGRSLTRCAFDEFDEDTYKNRILKRTAEVLVACSNVGPERKRELKQCLLFLRDVSSIDAGRIEWARLRYDRNNRGYMLLMNVCYMVLNDNVLTDETGEKNLASFLSGRELHNLYEKFVLEYFRKHHSGRLKASAKVIDQGSDLPAFLSRLQTDVTLEGPTGTLIMDCKFYRRILGRYYDHEALSEGNRYQLHAYTSGEQYATGRHTEGMLLYAKTSEEGIDPADWEFAGFSYHFRTLDLDCEFSQIAAQLDAIAEMV